MKAGREACFWCYMEQLFYGDQEQKDRSSGGLVYFKALSSSWDSLSLLYLLPLFTQHNPTKGSLAQEHSCSVVVGDLVTIAEAGRKFQLGCAAKQTTVLNREQSNPSQLKQPYLRAGSQ